MPRRTFWQFGGIGAARLASVLALLLLSVPISAQTIAEVTIANKPDPHSAGVLHPAQTRAAMRPKRSASGKVFFDGGELQIDAADSTLTEVLADVAAVTGVKIEIPPEGGTERMPLVRIGPGRAREVLGELLSDSSFDYIIQASDTDPDNVQCVLLMPRGKRDQHNDSPMLDMLSRGMRGRAMASARPEEPSAPAVSVPASAEPASSETAPQNPPPAPVEPDPSPLSPLNQPQQPPANRPGALTPPQTMTQDNINSQLQQMYQQRVQMIQQGRSTPGPSNGIN